MSVAALFTLSTIWEKTKWHLSNCDKHTQWNVAQQENITNNIFNNMVVSQNNYIN